MALDSILVGLLPRKHLRRNVAVAVACGFIILLVFGSGGALGFRPPAFPFPYEHVTYCGQIIAFGPCIANVQDNLGLAAVDFFFWLGALSFGVLGLIGLLSSPIDTVARTRFSMNKRRILGLIIVGVIGFSIFVPLLPVPGATHTVCGNSLRNCSTVADYGSLTFLFLCAGTEADTAGHYWWQYCLYF